MTYQAPKVSQDVRRLRMDIENAVRGFPHFHKYSSGELLRRQVRKVQRLVGRAWRDQDRQARWLELLVDAVDQLREDIELSQDVKAFKRLPQFHHLYSQVAEIGRQVGGWYRQKHPNAQNPQGRRAGAERGEKLSTHATPRGVNA